MKNFLKSFFAPSTTDTITASLAKTVAKLRTHSAASEALADDHSDLVDFHRAQMALHDTESARADRTADRIAKLLA